MKKDTFDNKYLLTETGDERFEPAEPLSSMDYSNRMTSLCGICFPGDVAP